jgi:transcriptional regulator with XRE-family HTH domain
VTHAERQELLRNAMGLVSLRELSLRLRVSPSTLDEWVSGQATMPDDAMFVLVAMLNEITWRERSTDAEKVDGSSNQPTNDSQKPRQSRNR